MEHVNRHSQDASPCLKSSRWIITSLRGSAKGSASPSDRWPSHSALPVVRCAATSKVAAHCRIAPSRHLRQCVHERGSRPYARNMQLYRRLRLRRVCGTKTLSGLLLARCTWALLLWALLPAVYQVSHRLDRRRHGRKERSKVR